MKEKQIEYEEKEKALKHRDRAGAKAERQYYRLMQRNRLVSVVFIHHIRKQEDRKQESQNVNRGIQCDNMKKKKARSGSGRKSAKDKWKELLFQRRHSQFFCSYLGTLLLALAVILLTTTHPPLWAGFAGSILTHSALMTVRSNP